MTRRCELFIFDCLVYFVHVYFRDPNSKELTVTWPPYDVQKREYLDFDFELSVKKDFHVDATRIFQPHLRELFQNEKEEL